MQSSWKLASRFAYVVECSRPMAACNGRRGSYSCAGKIYKVSWGTERFFFDMIRRRDCHGGNVCSGFFPEKHVTGSVLVPAVNVPCAWHKQQESLPVVDTGDGTLPPPERDAAHQVADDVEVPAFECDRTFCPPERGDHCPLSQHGLPQPRGDQSLMRRLDGGGLHNLKRSFKCPRAYHALLVDAAGTLIHASQSTQQIYHEIGAKYGVHLTEEEIAAKYKAAYGQPWCRYRMRYEDDGRLFWQLIVQEATGCKDPALLEDLYQYYTTDKAWHIGDPDAEKSLKAIRKAGIKLAVVSNFDTRLRPLMRVLQCYDWFDAIIVSAEVGLEKPNPEIFMAACRELGVKPDQVLHVGDDETNDVVGASAAGCDSLLWGTEVASFAEVAKKLGVKV